MIDIMNVRCPHCKHDFDVGIYVGEEVSGFNASLTRTTVQRINWQEINNEIQNGNANAILSLGDKIAFLLKDGRRAAVEVAAINHYAQNRVEFAFEDLLWMECMNANDTNRGGWAKSDIADTLENKILPLFPDELIDIIKPRRIMQKIRGKTYERESKLWLPSHTEMFGKKDGYEDVDFGDMQFPLYDTKKRRVKGNEKGETYWYRLRSPYMGYSAYFWIVDSYGNSNYTNASFALGVCPCFSI